MNEVTRIINAIEQGEAGAAERLLPLVYEELRILAAQKMAQEKPGHTLQATALVHEAYLRLLEGEGHGWNSRGHFFAAAAEAMRRILVESARKKKSHKRGGGHRKLDVDAAELAIDGSGDDLIALDEALTRLNEEEPQIASLVQLRYFAGLSLSQVAAILGISERTAARNWAYGRVWLLREIRKGDD